MLASPPGTTNITIATLWWPTSTIPLIGGVVLGLFAGAYYWWPKMFGYKLNEKLGKWSFWIFFIGFHLTFFIQHFLGFFGMPRRVFTYQPEDGVTMINQISTVGAFMQALGVILIVFNVFYSYRHRTPAGNDPWDGRTLEWSIPSPAPVYNFAQLPKVRALDAFWHEKMQGNKQMEPAEPSGPDPHAEQQSSAFLDVSGHVCIRFGFCLPLLGSGSPWPGLLLPGHVPPLLRKGSWLSH